jgi:hypothetical protein
MRRREKILIGLGLASVGLIAAGTIAWAAIPSADGVIHACYKNASGTLRVVDTATDTCSGNETPISWNQGLRGWEVKVAGSESNSDQSKSVVITCPPGKNLLGGGARLFPNNVPEIALTINAPAFPDQWVVGAHEVVPTDHDWSLDGYVLCANLTP